MSSTGGPTVESVFISSTRELVLPLVPTYLDSFDLQTEEHSIDCASGDCETGEWLGIRIDALLERTEMNERATHLLVTGADGHRACVPLADALDALLAIDRPDCPDDGTLPRLVGSDIEGAQSVGQITLVETVRLEPGESMDQYERPADGASSSSDPTHASTNGGSVGSEPDQ